MPVNLPLGFRFAGVHAGIKKNPNKEDLSLVHCPGGAVAAGAYTTNLVYAAPLAVDRQRTPSSDIRVVIVNSGNANGASRNALADAEEMCTLTAVELGCATEEVLVCSTGLIGFAMPMPALFVIRAAWPLT